MKRQTVNAARAASCTTWRLELLRFTRLDGSFGALRIGPTLNSFSKSQKNVVQKFWHCSNRLFQAHPTSKSYIIENANQSSSQRCLWANKTSSVQIAQLSSQSIRLHAWRGQKFLLETHKCLMTFVEVHFLMAFGGIQVCTKSKLFAVCKGATSQECSLLVLCCDHFTRERNYLLNIRSTWDQRWVGREILLRALMQLLLCLGWARAFATLSQTPS